VPEVIGVTKAQELRRKARTYRGMLKATTDHRLIKALTDLAAEYEALAAELETEGSGNSRLQID
jgi:hypothetical protein